MVSVVIAALSGTASIGTAGLMDALNKADLAPAAQATAAQATAGAPAPRVFDVRLAGLHGGAVSCRDGVSLQPVVAAADVAAPDLVVVPGLDDDLTASFDANRGWVPWLASWHAAGARIVSSCTGAFLVADAGLLEGRPATTHWMFADELRRRYPAVQVTADLSERTLSRRFAAATGRGPRAYVQHARRLLETAGDPIDQVRHRAGYDDPAAFRRVFKQATGLSPSGYRDAYGLRAD
jgi:transcriptional regulator GlxA family with amidase domain